MAKIPVPCPACQKTLKVAPEILGRKVRCPGCQAVVRLPKAESNGDPDRQPSTNLQKQKPQATTPVAEEPTAATEPTVKPAQETAASVRMGKLVGAAESEKAPVPKAVPLAAPILNPETPVAAAPRVKFKRKRTNPWPTVILAIVTLAVLGSVVTFITIMQQRPSVTADGALPEIRSVSDSTIAYGETGKIPIQVVFPNSMTEQQRSQWRVKVGEDAPEEAVYRSDTQAIHWTPKLKHVGTSHTIQAVVFNPETDLVNSVRFLVSVPALPATLKNLYDRIEAARTKGDKVELGDAVASPGAPETYYPLTVGGKTLRVFPTESKEVAAQLVQWADGQPNEMQIQKYAGDLQLPVMIAQRGPLILVGRSEDIENNAALRRWFQDDQPSESLATEENDAMPSVFPPPNVTVVEPAADSDAQATESITNESSVSNESEPN